MANPYSGPVLLVVARNPDTRDELMVTFELLRSEFQNLQIKPLDPQHIAGGIDRACQGIVIDLDRWSHADEMMTAGLRGTGYIGPILILCQHEPTDVLPATRTFDKVVLLNKPYNIPEMVGIAKRMLLEPIIAARKFPRHMTNETAEMQIEGQKTVFACKVRNMSKGGAYIEIDRTVQMRIGDSVIVKIKLAKVNREYALRGRVAWLNDRRTAFGMEFLVTA